MNDTKTVLIVDDDNQDRKKLQEMLQGAGYATVTAKSGVDALPHLQRTRIDLIVLDLIMPEMDGFAMLRILRKTPCFEKTPVIVVSAANDITSYDLAARLGVLAFVPKSDSMDDELLGLIKRHLAKHRA
jgi:CheY-like chemotaxis protein